MNRTSIEWTDYTTNPVRFRPHGSARTVAMCQKISPGCKTCYAAQFGVRFWPKDSGIAYPGYTAEGVASGAFELVESELLAVLKHRGPCKLFWGDMTDLFGEWVTDEWLDRMFAVMALTPHITHQVLTKRPERMRQYLVSTDVERRVALACVRDQQPIGEGYFSQPVSGGDLYEVFRYRGTLYWIDDGERYPCSDAIWYANDFRWPLPNVWLGVSVENKEQADKRIEVLEETPAAVRFVSGEPLLELTLFKSLRLVDWVIVGGESGPGARPCDVQWIRSIVKQCKAAGTKCFVKQLGAKPFESSRLYGAEHREIFLKQDRKGGDPAEWPEGLRVREFPEVQRG